MNYRQWMAQLNPAFRDAFYDSPVYCMACAGTLDDLYLYLMM